MSEATATVHRLADRPNTSFIKVFVGCVTLLDDMAGQTTWHMRRQRGEWQKRHTVWCGGLLYHKHLHFLFIIHFAILVSDEKYQAGIYVVCICDFSLSTYL